jgi:hypothetical protein
MDPLSKNMSLVRYGVVLIAMCGVAIGFRGLKTTSIIGVIFFALICLKYPFSDYLLRMTRRRWPMLKVLPWLWIGYVLAAIVDLAATWVAMSDDTGASFGLWVAIFVSPCLLAGAFVLMIIHTLVARKR